MAAGACVAPSVADAYCGPWCTATADGCTVRPCAAGEQLDAATGACVGAAALRQAAADSNIGIDRNARLACADGSPPVLADGRFACVPSDALCPRGTRRSGAGCDRTPLCAPGELRDANRCRRVVTRGGTGPRVDIGAWLHALVGPDGGLGAPDLCAPLALRPAAFALGPRRSMRVTVTLELRIPDNDLSLVELSTWATGDATAGAPLSAAATALVDTTARSLVETLRGLGGESWAAAARTTVTCVVEALDPPSP
jgi:hypothetical protein